MDVTNLLVPLGVEGSHLLAGRCLQCLFEVAAQTIPSRNGLIRDRIASIDALSLVGRLELLIKSCEGIGEAS